MSLLYSSFDFRDKYISSKEPKLVNFHEDKTNLFLLGDDSAITKSVEELYEAFESKKDEISKKRSNGVLSEIHKSFNNSDDFIIESKKEEIKLSCIHLKKEIKVTYPDGFIKSSKTIFEIEGGKAIENNNVLKDLLECLSCNRLDDRPFRAEHLIVAVPNVYKVNGRSTYPFKNTVKAYYAFYLSKGKRLPKPLRGIVVLGYKKT